MQIKRMFYGAIAIAWAIFIAEAVALFWIFG